jgi:outer membrane scaffolding protein for murein synthesis (MipA/OmpV family)
MRRFLALVLVVPASALAFDPGTYLGAAVRSYPEYTGSADQQLMLIPLVRYYGPILFARTTQGVLEGGARAELVKGLAAGVQIAYEEENDRTGLDPSASYGVHMEWDTNIGRVPVNLLARARFDFDSDNGSQTDLRASVGVYGSGRLGVGMFGQATWGNSDWFRAYYGADGSGLVYTALGIEGQYELGRHWLLIASAHARFLQGDASSSPITEERTNYFASAGVAYRF